MSQHHPTTSRPLPTDHCAHSLSTAHCPPTPANHSPVQPRCSANPYGPYGAPRKIPLHCCPPAILARSCSHHACSRLRLELHQTRNCLGGPRPHSALDVHVSISMLKKSVRSSVPAPHAPIAVLCCPPPALDATTRIHLADSRQNLVLMQPSTSTSHTKVPSSTWSGCAAAHNITVPWHDSWANVRCQTRTRPRS